MTSVLAPPLPTDDAASTRTRPALWTPTLPFRSTAEALVTAIGWHDLRHKCRCSVSPSEIRPELDAEHLAKRWEQVRTKCASFMIVEGSDETETMRRYAGLEAKNSLRWLGFFILIELWLNLRYVRSESTGDHGRVKDLCAELREIFGDDILPELPGLREARDWSKADKKILNWHWNQWPQLPCDRMPSTPA